MELTPNQCKVLDSDGHLLVTGGPGAGKTTVSILKAAKIAEDAIGREQRVLFVSFARATVSRVEEAISQESHITKQSKKKIYVETYHSFFWSIIKSYGYLIGMPKKLTLLAPPQEAVALSSIQREYGSKLTTEEKIKKDSKVREELERLAFEEGKVCFGMFAYLCIKVLHLAERIPSLIANRYPVIVLDEFQDTVGDQWEVIKLLGEKTTLIALADPEQRIYGWAGASPERLGQFKAFFNPIEINLSSDNHRSPNTDILKFGNDILTGNFRTGKGAYSGVNRQHYPANTNQAWPKLIFGVLKAKQRLVKSGLDNWSIAVLVPTKKLTRLVSDAMRTPIGKYPTISHKAIIEVEAAILAAEFIAYALLISSKTLELGTLTELLTNYYYGRGGSSPKKGDLEKAAKISNSFSEYQVKISEGKKLRANSFFHKTLTAFEKLHKVQLVGNPEEDWITVRQTLEGCECVHLKSLAIDAKNLRLLNRGNQLRALLAQDWRENGSYTNSLELVRESFIKEHFSTSTQAEKGVIIMNMHKAKGKQFDEVFIFEGWPKKAKGKVISNADRIVKDNQIENAGSQARQNLRVSVTRAKSRVTILTPETDTCIILRKNNHCTKKE